MLSVNKKIKERICEGELKCEKCGRRFYIKNSIACFVDFNKQKIINIKKLRRISLNQEIPRKWLKFFSKEEFAALQKEWNWLSLIIKKQKNSVHLDFATGTGRFLRNIVSKTKGEIVALDFSYPVCLELVYFLKKIKKYSRISIVCADARKMPFKNEIFDSITSWHGLDEPRMEKAIKESRRILKNGAYLAVSGLHYQKNSKSFLLAKKHGIGFTDKKTVIQNFKKAGFQKIEYKNFFFGRWNEKGSYLPKFGDFYSTYAIRVRKNKPRSRASSLRG